MRLATLALLGMLMTGPTVYADHHECSCDKACAEKCAKGEGKETCECKTCDCKNTGKCSHGKCEHKEHKKDSKKKN